MGVKDSGMYYFPLTVKNVSVFSLLHAASEPVDDTCCASTCLNSTGVFTVSISAYQTLHACKITKSKMLFKINSVIARQGCVLYTNLSLQNFILYL